MQDVVREACEAVQAAAPKGETAIRRMLTAEFQARPRRPGPFRSGMLRRTIGMCVR